MPSSKPPPYLVADHLALDFLNSICAPTGEMIDWLDTGAEALNWLIASQAVEKSDVEHLQAPEFSQLLNKTADTLKKYREDLRIKLLSRKQEDLDAIIIELNSILEKDKLHYSIQNGETSAGKSLNIRREYISPDQMILPIAHAVADLICNQNYDRIRNCDGPTCTIEFLDTSKNGKRRWCSMQVCGNRAKASAHRQRAKTS